MQISTGDLALFLGSKVYQNQNCIQAWGEFGVGHLVDLMNAVRNRILDFSLAVWKESPTAGEIDDTRSSKLEPTKVTQIFNTTVYGGSANLVGTATDSEITFNLSPADIPGLEAILRENGIKDTELYELRTALAAEPQPPADKVFGPKVSSWISKMIEKAADGTWNVSLGAAGNLLAQALGKYYGLYFSFITSYGGRYAN